jgi:hypothetical protein
MADKISSGMAGSDGDSNPTSLSRGDAGCKSAKRRSAKSARCCQCCTEKLLPDIAMQSKCFCNCTAFNTSGRGSLVNRSQTGQGKPQDSRGGMPLLLSALTATARVLAVQGCLTLPASSCLGLAMKTSSNWHRKPV